jgi:hypothetical protein
VTSYAFDYDPALWIDVPLDFAGTQWGSAEEWANDVARQITVGAPEPLSVREAYAETALEVARLEVAGAADRFWYFPVEASFVSVVNCFVVPRELIGAEATIEQFAGSDEESLTVPSIELLDSAPFGRVALGLTTSAITGSDDERVVVGQARLVGEAEDHVFMLEVLDRELGRIAVMLDDMTTLFESVRFASE